jgi:hypothetical protein
LRDHTLAHSSASSRVTPTYFHRNRTGLTTKRVSIIKPPSAIVLRPRRLIQASRPWQHDPATTTGTSLASIPVGRGTGGLAFPGRKRQAAFFALNHWRSTSTYLEGTAVPYPCRDPRRPRFTAPQPQLGLRRFHRLTLTTLCRRASRIRRRHSFCFNRRRAGALHP